MPLFHRENKPRLPTYGMVLLPHFLFKEKVRKRILRSRNAHSGMRLAKRHAISAAELELEKIAEIAKRVLICPRSIRLRLRLAYAPVERKRPTEHFRSGRVPPSGSAFGNPASRRNPKCGRSPPHGGIQRESRLTPGPLSLLAQRKGGKKRRRNRNAQSSDRQADSRAVSARRRAACVRSAETASRDCVATHDPPRFRIPPHQLIGK